MVIKLVALACRRAIAVRQFSIALLHIFHREQHARTMMRRVGVKKFACHLNADSPADEFFESRVLTPVQNQLQIGHSSFGLVRFVRVAGDADGSAETEYPECFRRVPAPDAFVIGRPRKSLFYDRARQVYFCRIVGKTITFSKSRSRSNQQWPQKNEKPGTNIALHFQNPFRSHTPACLTVTRIKQLIATDISIVRLKAG